MKQKVKAEIPQEYEEIDSNEASPLEEREIVPEEESKTDNSD